MGEDPVSFYRMVFTGLCLLLSSIGGLLAVHIPFNCTTNPNIRHCQKGSRAGEGNWGYTDENGPATWAEEFKDADMMPYIMGGRLPEGEKFQFLQLHWHWGSDSSKGSEHTMDGKEYPLELHLVHWILL